jgi:hypothetical protein
LLPAQHAQQVLGLGVARHPLEDLPIKSLGLPQQARAVEVESTTKQLPERGHFFLGGQPLGHGTIPLPDGAKI